MATILKKVLYYVLYMSSQFGQDEDVLQHYNNLEEGYFVEVGGYDGVNLSNTVKLEKKYRWKGFLVECNPSLAEQSRNSIRTCKTIECACYDKSGLELEMYDHKALGSLVNVNSKWNYIIKNSPKIKVKTRTLTEILDEEQAPQFIEYLSIDVEGAEPNVLGGIDFNKYFFGYITIEHNSVPEMIEFIRNYLTTRGYKYLKTKCCDDHYVLDDSKHLYYGCEADWDQEDTIRFFLKHAFPEKKLVFCDRKAQVLYASFFGSIKNRWNKNPKIPYLYRSGERYPMKSYNSNPHIFLESAKVNGGVHAPFIFYALADTLNHLYKYPAPVVNHGKLLALTEPPKFIPKKERWFAYCHSHEIPYRQQLFRTAHAMFPNDVWALGKDNAGIKDCNKEHIGGNWRNIPYEKYKFACALENFPEFQGYITEKIVMPLISNCIPIYKGADDIARSLFHKDRVIYLDDFANMEDCLRFCHNMPEAEYQRRLALPILNDQKFLMDWADHIACDVRNFLNAQGIY